MSPWLCDTWPSQHWLGWLFLKCWHRMPECLLWGLTLCRAYTLYRFLEALRILGIIFLFSVSVFCVKRTLANESTTLSLLSSLFLLSIFSRPVSFIFHWCDKASWPKETYGRECLFWLMIVEGKSPSLGEGMAAISMAAGIQESTSFTHRKQREWPAKGDKATNTQIQPLMTYFLHSGSML